MRELFYEESASSQNAHAEEKKHTVFRVLTIIFAVLAGLYAFLILYASLPFLVKDMEGLQKIVVIIVWVMPFVFLVGLGVFCFFWKKRYNISYDYTVVEDELRIAKVFNGQKRKYIASLKKDFVLQFGPCDSEGFRRREQGSKKDMKYVTPNKTPGEEKIFIYVIYSTSLAKTVYVLECRQIMLDYFVAAFGRNKLELR